MAGGESSPERPDESAVHRPAAGELLERGRYEQLAEILRQADVACQAADDAPLAHVLAAARRICEACRQIRAEVEWHRQAREAADRRERELRDQLQGLLDLIDTGKPPATTGDPPSVSGTAPGSPDPRASEPSGRAGLWRRFWSLLARPSPRPPQVWELRAAPAGLPSTGVGETAPSGGPASLPVRARPEEPAQGAGLAGGGADLLGASPTPGVDPPAAAPAEVPATLATPSTVQADDLSADSADQDEPGELPRGESEPQLGQVDSAGLPGADAPWPPATEAALVSPVDSDKQKGQASCPLVVYCLGPFRVYQDDQPVEDWRSSKGKCIFKYLVAHRERPVPKEVLMELFWPGAHPDAARNNLNVAIYGLRQALREARPSFSHVLFQDDCYLLNPDLNVWVDVEEFTERLRTARSLERHGELVAAIREYRAAEALYQGEFLEEDRYEDWLIPQRQSLRDDFLGLLDCMSCYYFDKEDYAACAAVCGRMVAVDVCREEAHRRLMRCYSRQGQAYLALRQYHLCVEALDKELDVTPAPATMELFERIRQREPV